MAKEAAARSTVSTSATAATPKPYKILVVDDHSIVRRGIRSLLETQPDMQVCAEAADGATAMEQVIKERPNLVVLDLTMPEKNGLEVTRLIREESPSSEVLILTMHFSEEVAREVLRCGARGYILKSDADSELLAAVRHIKNNKPFFTGKLAASMAESFVRDTRGSGNNGKAEDVALSNREMEVVQLLARGKSNKEAAAMLGVSTRTVESHRNHIMRKMEFGSFSDLIRFAIRSNLIQA
ncbi:MAG TPA: response regulator transcription factor [Candidatus Acidoferrales bacterium]|jgi:DNA-binding NarL/FixJ family response regulator|nr:response regulator transcription factor [Candidatus Acidoferrales bacterium]